MLITLWIINGLLGLVFLAAGAMKLFRPKTALRSSGMPWVDDFAGPVVKLIGAVEIIGAAGLILPLLTGTAAILTPIAAVGLAVLMLGAATVHARRKENLAAPLILALLALASAVLGFIVVTG